LLNTGCILLFVAHIVYHDLPWHRLPFLKKFK
jgi:hypothetical protein